MKFTLRILICQEWHNPIFNQDLFHRDEITFLIELSIEHSIRIYIHNHIGRVEDVTYFNKAWERIRTSSHEQIKTQELI